MCIVYSSILSVFIFKNTARVRNCPEITILNSLFCLFVININIIIIIVIISIITTIIISSFSVQCIINRFHLFPLTLFRSAHIQHPLQIHQYSRISRKYFRIQIQIHLYSRISEKSTDIQEYIYKMPGLPPFSFVYKNLEKFFEI